MRSDRYKKESPPEETKGHNLKEDQYIEFKEYFKDDHLKVVSAFANSGGGKLIIGVNDKSRW